MIDVPAIVRNKAVAVGAARWLDDLHLLVEGLERDWNMRIGRVFPDASEALVAEVTLADESVAVLKLIVPRYLHTVRHEIMVLRLADGEGCARLLRSDESRGALLLERLGPSLHDLGLPLAKRLEILTSVAARIWRPAPDAGLPTGADKGRWLIEFITTTWEESRSPLLGSSVRPCARLRGAACCRPR